MTRSVLQVVATAARRGAEVFAVDLGRTLAERGFAVATVALVRGGDGARIDAPVLGPRRLGPTTLRRLRSEMQRRDVAVGHGSSSLPATTVAGLGTRVPIVYRSIGDPRYWARTPTARRRVAAFLGRTAAVVALTDGAADALREAYGLAASKIHVIPKGVPAERFQPVDAGRRAHLRGELGIDGERPTIAYLGALSGEKNVALAVRAVSRLTDAVLLIGGDGPDRADLEGLAGAVAPGRVRFLGSLPDPALLLGAADVLVLSSDTEGLPGALMEAGMAGLPSVTTDVGWVREIVVDGETGVVVPPGDESALADGLRVALEDAQRLGVAARRHCLERFEIGVVADRWEKLLATFPAR